MPLISARLILGIASAVLLYLFLSWFPRIPPPLPLIYDNHEITTKPKRSWCRTEECALGRWTPRQQVTPHNRSREFKTYASQLDVLWKGCISVPRDGVVTEFKSPKGSVDEARLMQIMNWTWTPYVGELRSWDPEDFMVRLLKSPGGLILIGDSITLQHYHSIGYLLYQGNFDFVRNPPHLPMYDHRNVHQMLLKPDTPLTRRVLERAGVPESRLERPVITMLEDHMLVGQRDIQDITEPLGGSRDYKDFVHVPDWMDYVAEAVKPRLEEEGTLSEDSILLMNTGAHWSRNELAMLPRGPTYRDEQARVKESHRQMMKLVIRRISAIDRLTVFFRSTVPAHPACEKSGKPYDNGLVAREAERNITLRLVEWQAQAQGGTKRQEPARWDWDLFEAHNEPWRRAIGGLMWNRESQKSRIGTPMGAKWYYLDLWDVNLQRPDAHSEPGSDCLHWCLPSVFNEWTLHLYHNLFLQSISEEGGN